MEMSTSTRLPGSAAEQPLWIRFDHTVPPGERSTSAPEFFRTSAAAWPVRVDQIVRRPDVIARLPEVSQAQPRVVRGRPRGPDDASAVPEYEVAERTEDRAVGTVRRAQHLPRAEHGAGAQHRARRYGRCGSRHDESADRQGRHRDERPEAGHPASVLTNQPETRGASTSIARSTPASSTSRWVTRRRKRGPSAETSTPSSRASRRDAPPRPSTCSTTMLVCAGSAPSAVGQPGRAGVVVGQPRRRGGPARTARPRRGCRPAACRRRTACATRAPRAIRSARRDQHRADRRAEALGQAHRDGVERRRRARRSDAPVATCAFHSRAPSRCSREAVLAGQLDDRGDLLGAAGRCRRRSCACSRPRSPRRDEVRPGVGRDRSTRTASTSSSPASRVPGAEGDAGEHRGRAELGPGDVRQRVADELLARARRAAAGRAGCPASRTARTARPRGRAARRPRPRAR